MNSYINYLMDPKVFCYMSYNIQDNLLYFTMISKDSDIEESINDTVFYKWINHIGDIISKKIEYLNKYKIITIVAINSVIQLDKDVTILKIANIELYQKLRDEIKRVCDYDIDSIELEDNQKFNSEKTGYSTSEDVDELDRILVWNWDLDQFDLDVYRADTWEDKAPLNLTFMYGKDVVCLFKSRKFEKDNVFFTELVRR